MPQFWRTQFRIHEKLSRSINLMSIQRSDGGEANARNTDSKPGLTWMHPSPATTATETDPGRHLMNIPIHRQAREHIQAEQHRWRLLARLQRVMSNIYAGDTTERLTEIQMMLEDLPPRMRQNVYPGNCLSRAQRYLDSREYGAARYELRQMLTSLQKSQLESRPATT